MSEQMVSGSIRCSKCGVPQAPSEFYERYPGGPRMRQCKECFKARSREQVPKPKQESSHISEGYAIARMARFGIHALPGKTISAQYTDVIAWGCIKIECKAANADKNGQYHFAFSPQQRAGKLHGELVVLICMAEDPKDYTYHVLPADHPCFFHENGGRKRAIAYTPGVTAATKKRATSMTDEIMRTYRDAWHQVEALRQGVVARLLSGADPIEIRPAA